MEDLLPNVADNLLVCWGEPGVDIGELTVKVGDILGMFLEQSRFMIAVKSDTVGGGKDFMNQWQGRE